MMKTFVRYTLIILLAGICGFVSFSTARAQATAQGEAAARQSPNDVLRSAQTIYIRSDSAFFKASSLENSLLQKQEFQDWGMVITRTEVDADLIIEVSRKAFTNSFIFSVLDPHNNRVVASGRVNSLGGTVEGKISDSFIKRLRLAHAQAPPAPTK